MKWWVLVIACLYSSVMLGKGYDGEENLRLFRMRGQSPAIARYLHQLNAQGRFHVIFIVTLPRVYAFGEMIIKELIEQFQKAGFKGSISVIVRGRRYYADVAYTRSWGWGVPCLVDPDGTLLKQIGIARSNFPIATIWDTTGTLWWWSYVDVVPTGQDLKKFLAELTASTQPFEEVKKFHSHFTREACVAESVGVGELGVSAAGIGRVVSLEDDSLHRVGPLTGCVISGNGRWLAAMDMYLQCIRVYELEKGRLVATMCGDTHAFRARSWYVPDTIYQQARKFFWSNFVSPSFTDSTLWSILITTYVRCFNDSSHTIDKSYLFVGYNPPFTRIACAAEFNPAPQCRGEYCTEGNFYPGGGLVISRGCFFLPYRRGFLAIGYDTPPEHPYDNPLSDTFYTYAPLYGAFSTETGMFLDSTIGELNPRVGKAYGFGLANHYPSQMSCDYQSGQCAWIQWLVPEIQLGNGRSIPLEHYWNPTMVYADREMPRSSLPEACERSVILDSAGAMVDEVIMVPDYVYVLWWVKKKGVPLNDFEKGYIVLQKYSLATAQCIGKWLLPNYYGDQKFLRLCVDRHKQVLAGLYQGVRNTTLVYYDLREVPQSQR